MRGDPTKDDIARVLQAEGNSTVRDMLRPLTPESVPYLDTFLDTRGHVFGHNKACSYADG